MYVVLKKFALTLIMAVVTTLIGIFINQVANALTENITNIFPTGKTGMNGYERQIYDHIVNPQNISDRMSTVGGLQEIKEDINANVLMPLKYPKIFFSKDSKILSPSRGILLHGPPGTGKTMLARVIAAEANVPFLSLSLSALENKYYGESNKLIQASFSLARKLQPCIVFFDEIDGLMKQRNELDQSAVYGFKTELLSQIDGMDSQENDSIFVIGTTNNIAYLDPAIKRRLPKVYKMQLPNATERRAILKLKLGEEEIADEILDWVSTISETLSGSDLAELVRRASAFRLQDQCKDLHFQTQLEIATCIKDMYPLMKLNAKHFQDALIAMGIDVNESEISEDDIGDEGVPPEVL